METPGYQRVSAEISLHAIQNNIRICKTLLAPKTKVMAVVKANAYGHGSIAVSHAVCDLVDAFAVATIEEGIELREAGIRKPILILGYTPPEAAEEAIRQDISLTVFQYDIARQYEEKAKALHKQAHVHIKVDTGMGRIGLFANEEGLSEAVKIGKLDGLCTDGVFSHFARADEADREYTLHQLQLFTDFCDRLEKAGVSTGMRHISNSAGILSFPEAQLDMVRMGIIMYGLYPSEETKRLDGIRPALSLVSSISYLKTVPEGTGISYGSTYITKRETRVATIPVGYGDGYKRALSNKGSVLIRGNYAPILGRVCMDQFMADVTDIEGVRQNDKVTLIGSDGKNRITAQQIGELSESFHYEILCDIGRRIPRIYKQD